MDDLTIRGFESLAGINERGVVTPGRQVESQGFVELLKGAIDNVNQIQHESGRLQDAVARGENMNIHQAIIAGEKAGLSFQLMMQVRNKLLDAYQEVARLRL